jgi:hypothetical protein
MVAKIASKRLEEVQAFAAMNVMTDLLRSSLEHLCSSMVWTIRRASQPRCVAHHKNADLPAVS